MYNVLASTAKVLVHNFHIIPIRIINNENLNIFNYVKWGLLILFLINIQHQFTFNGNSFSLSSSIYPSVSLARPKQKARMYIII